MVSVYNENLIQKNNSMTILGEGASSCGNHFRQKSATSTVASVKFLIYVDWFIHNVQRRRLWGRLGLRGRHPVFVTLPCH